MSWGGALGFANPTVDEATIWNAHAAPNPAPAATFNAVFLSPERLAALKAKVEAGHEPWASAYERLIQDADRALRQRPRSVTDNGGPVAGGRDRHKFGTDHPTAPDADRSDYGAASAMGNWIRDLGLAYAFTGDERYADKAVDFLYHWAVNPKTRMEPSTKNFSPHRASSTKKKQNSIEIYISLPQMFYGASFVMGHGRWAEKGTSAERDFLRWTRAIAAHADVYYKGQPNNIYAWRTVTQAAAAALVGDRALMQRAFDNWKETAIEQIDEEGKLYWELKRTNALGYSLYAVKALTLTAEIASFYGVDLYDHRDGKGGAALKRALDYHAGYVVNPSAWPFTRNRSQNLSGDAATYELAYSRWKERRYLDVVGRHGRPLKENRVAGWTTLTHASLFKLESRPESKPELAVAITSPRSQAVFAAPAEVTIEADVRGFEKGEATVAFYANGTKVGERTSAPYRLVWSRVAPGRYAITAEATDRRGGMASTSAPTEIAVVGRAGGGITAPAKVEVRRVRARSSQKPNVAARARDGKLSTRWSAKGQRQWLRFDLEGRYRISAVDVAWYKGDERRASFDVEVSTDGRRWQRVFRGRSSGKKTGLERVTFEAREARHVRIVGRGNTKNTWNSITEVELQGDAIQAASKAAGAEALPLALEADLRTSEAAAPGAFELGQSYPNPLVEATTIAYRLPQAAQVTLAIYDVAGRQIRTLVRERQAAGRHEVAWDGCDGAGRPLPSGLYLYRLVAGAQRQARTLTLLR